MEPPLLKIRENIRSMLRYCSSIHPSLGALQSLPALLPSVHTSWCTRPDKMLQSVQAVADSVMLQNQARLGDGEGAMTHCQRWPWSRREQSPRNNHMAP
jgi:hypothetical protein